MIIFYKRLKLKSEIEDSSLKHRKIKAAFFLPAFLPIYGIIPDIYIRTFEENYWYNKETSFACTNSFLSVNAKLLFRDLELSFNHTKLEYLKRVVAKSFYQ